MKYRVVGGVDGFLGKLTIGWLGGWVGSPVFGHDVPRELECALRGSEGLLGGLAREEIPQFSTASWALSTVDRRRSSGRSCRASPRNPSASAIRYLTSSAVVTLARLPFFSGHPRLPKNPGQQVGADVTPMGVGKDHPTRASYHQLVAATRVGTAKAECS